MQNSRNMVIIGSSSGGPQTLKRVLARLYLLNACVIIVQHMPKFINASLQNSLARATAMQVEIAEDGTYLEDGIVLIAPSETHLELVDNRTVKLNYGEKVNFVCPSVDVTMKSVERRPRVNVVGAVLTGIGIDGAQGIRHIKNVGGVTIAQDEETSIIYGMPKAAVATGKVDFILPPEAIGDKIRELVSDVVHL